MIPHRVTYVSHHSSSTAYYNHHHHKMFQVYRIRTHCAPNNEYFINRHEEWGVYKDECFDTLEADRAHVIQQSIEHSDMLIYGQTIVGEQEKREFYSRFCFGE